MSLVSCDNCHKVLAIPFGEGLAKGWPTCCGSTMRLGSTTHNDIEQGVAHAMRPFDAVRKALKGMRVQLLQQQLQAMTKERDEAESRSKFFHYEEKLKAHDATIAELKGERDRWYGASQERAITIARLKRTLKELLVQCEDCTYLNGGKRLVSYQEDVDLKKLSAAIEQGQQALREG